MGVHEQKASTCVSPPVYAMSQVARCSMQLDVGRGRDDSDCWSVFIGFCAYACQCSWVAVRESQECSTVGNLKWVCGGHTTDATPQ